MFPAGAVFIFPPCPAAVPPVPAVPVPSWSHLTHHQPLETSDCPDNNKKAESALLSASVSPGSVRPVIVRPATRLKTLPDADGHDARRAETGLREAGQRAAEFKTDRRHLKGK